jgi:hypothetical protein
LWIIANPDATWQEAKKRKDSTKMMYPQQPPSTLDATLDETLRLMIKFIVLVYLAVSAVIALFFSVVIVGVTVSYMLLRFMIRFVNAQLAKHSECRRAGFKYSGFRNGFTLRGALLH